MAQHMPMGSVIKTNVYYKTPFWRTRGYSGVIISDEGPVLYGYDDCKPDGSAFAIMGFINAKQGRIWAECSPEQRKQAICEQYRKIFRSDEALSPIGYAEKNWSAEQFSGGCYFSVMPPNVMTHYGKVLRKNVGPVHFAGTETATRWMGYMDGAAQAGEREAHKVLENLTKLGLSHVKLHVSQFQEIETPSTEIVALPIVPVVLEKIKKKTTYKKARL